jgi:hypothetical protein
VVGTKRITDSPYDTSAGSASLAAFTITRIFGLSRYGRKSVLDYRVPNTALPVSRRVNTVRCPISPERVNSRLGFEGRVVVAFRLQTSTLSS